MVASGKPQGAASGHTCPTIRALQGRQIFRASLQDANIFLSLIQWLRAHYVSRLPLATICRRSRGSLTSFFVAAIYGINA